MTTEPVRTNAQTDRALEGERGILLAMLVMVVLGVVGIFFTS